MQEKELVKIASNNPAHPKGYYIQFKDRMREGDVEYVEPGLEQEQEELEPDSDIENKKGKRK